MTVRKSAATEFMPDARRAYEHGVSIRALRKRYNMSRSELEDCCPEEFEDAPTQDNGIGGY